MGRFVHTCMQSGPSPRLWAKTRNNHGRVAHERTGNVSRVLDRVLRGRKRCFVVHFFRSLRCAANAQRSPRRRCNRCDENLSCRETRAEMGAIRVELALCSVHSYECYSSWPRKWSQGRGKSQTNKDASENDMGALLDMLCAIFSRGRY